MPKYATEAIRAIALVGHGAAGKTTLAEALLHRAGAIPEPGSVAKGTTVCDFDPLEKEFQHSLATSIVNFAHGDVHIQLVDTPGFPDFLGQSLNALEAVETAAVVINAENGIEMVTHRMMQWAADRGLCRMIVIIKVNFETLNRLAFVLITNGNIGSTALPILGRYAGGPEGTALVMTAYTLLGMLLFKGTYHLTCPVHFRYGCNTTRDTLWVFSVVGRATSLHTRYPAIGLGYAAAGPPVRRCTFTRQQQ